MKLFCNSLASSRNLPSELLFFNFFLIFLAAMLSRLNPARQTVRVLSLAKSAGGSEVAKSAPAAQWASPEEQAQIAANFQARIKNLKYYYS